MKRLFSIIAFACCYLSTMQAHAQTWRLNDFKLLSESSLRAAASPLPGLRSNSVSDVVIHNDQIWLGTNKGLSRSNDGGQTWVTYDYGSGLPRGGVSAIAVQDDIIWVATAFDSLTKDAGELTTGGGLAYSLDDGVNWQRVPQPGITPVQNVSYDIALLDNEVWITSFGGGLRHSSDRGQNWVESPPDSSLAFDPLNRLNHRAFSVINADGVLWVGTAGGVNKSIDNGLTWTNFSHQNQSRPISGNFVRALGQQKWAGAEYIWAVTAKAEDENEISGVSVSEDGGYSWRTTLLEESCWNFAFENSVVYVCSDNGLFKSLDFGRSWVRFADIEDRANDERYLSTSIYAAGVTSTHVLWAGGGDGTASTADGGLTWTIQRGTVRPGSEREPRTFAYPSPFSPSRHNNLRDDGHVRFQYNTTNATQVTVRVYDFAMDLVAEVANNVSRPAGGSFSEIWNGRNQRGDVVANGVYFYCVELDGDGTYWGKVMVLD
jgi:hypothetical protein